MADLPPWLETRPTEPVDHLMAGLQLGLEFKQNRQRNELAKAELGQKAQELQIQGQRLQIQDQALTQGMKLKIQAAQRQHAADQGYMRDIELAGDDPNKKVAAQMKWFPMMGMSSGSLGAEMAALRWKHQIPPEVLQKQKQAATERQFKLRQLYAEKTRIDKAEAALPQAMLDEQQKGEAAKTLRIQRERNQAAFSALKHNPAGEDSGGDDDKQKDATVPDSGGSGTGSGSDVVATYDPATGTFKKSGK